MTNELVLEGCRPTPLASYLKALAVLRLVAEAGVEGGGDPDATGFWRDDVFVLRTRLTRQELCAFFLDRYRPTPLIAPWNGGSGFYPDDNKLGVEALSRSAASRFSQYREAIELGQGVVARFGLMESPKLDNKGTFLTALRNIASEPLLRWMDAAVIQSGNGPRYQPLLGTGGNDGRLDFTNNFMQRLAEIVDIDTGTPCEDSSERLSAALFATPTDALSGKPIGQFSPGAAGGPNAASGFEGHARINPWDFVLMLEGAVLFAASASRRLESIDASALVAPFTVRSRAGTVGLASVGDDADARGEIWMPLWRNPCSLDEIGYLLGEGRAALHARAAHDGLDFARAVAQLGVDRGIISFQRFGFLMRSGKAFLASPLSRIPVQRNSDGDLIVDLERNNWLALAQRYAREEDAPGTLSSAVQRLERALFALVQQVSGATLQSVMRCVGTIEAVLHNSAKSRDAVRVPVPQLSSSWAIKADDHSAEFRIAAALAGLCIRDEHGHRVLHARRHLAAVSECFNKEGDRRWEPSSRLAVWGPGPISRNLATLLHRRRLEAIALGCEGEVLASQTGATRADVAAFLERATDDTRIAELLGGLACVDWTDADPPTIDRPLAETAVLPPAFTLLKLFFTPESVLRLRDWLPADRTVRLPAEIPARLAADDVAAAVRIAWQRLRVLGVQLPGRDAPQVVAVAGMGPRWLAALCIPLTSAETGRLLHGLHLSPERDAGNPQFTEVTNN